MSQPFWTWCYIIEKCKPINKTKNENFKCSFKSSSLTNLPHLSTSRTGDPRPLGDDWSKVMRWAYRWCIQPVEIKNLVALVGSIMASCSNHFQLQRCILLLIICSMVESFNQESNKPNKASACYKSDETWWNHHQKKLQVINWLATQGRILMVAPRISAQNLACAADSYCTVADDEPLR